MCVTVVYSPRARLSVSAAVLLHDLCRMLCYRSVLSFGAVGRSVPGLSSTVSPAVVLHGCGQGVVKVI